MRLRHVPIRVGARTLNIGGGTRVRAKLTRQHGQYYAVGKDVKGMDRCGVGAKPDDAYMSLSNLLRAAKRYHER
jgi:hypothetical protein